MRVSDEFCSILTQNYLLLKYYLSNIETIKNQDVSSFLKASQIKTDIMFSKQVEYWDFFYVKFVFILELLARIVIRLVTILCFTILNDCCFVASSVTIFQLHFSMCKNNMRSHNVSYKISQCEFTVLYVLKIHKVLHYIDGIKPWFIEQILFSHYT